MAGQLRNQDSIPRRNKNVSLFHSIQTGSGIHPASYAKGKMGSFPESKVARA
jgi:hypothetical protein